MTIETILNDFSDRQILKAAEAILAQQYVRGVTMTDQNVAKGFCRHKLAGKEREQFLVILLDNKNQLIHHKILFKGTINQVSVYPREVVRYAFKHNASAVMVSHQHPSGDSTPSQSDIQITKRLVDALGLLNMRLLDHLIVGADHCASMAELGHI